MSTLLIMAGGTGGHVFPALAVARDLRARGVRIVWLGTRNGLEARTVPAAGFEIEWITIRGLRGKGWWGHIRAPFLILAAMYQAMRVVRRQRPVAMLGMGGFVAGPGGAVAWLLRRPLLIHEANAVAGLTNRLLARLATRVMTGFPGTFANVLGSECVGNPVRPEIAALPAPAERLAERSGPLRLLVVGGSQGARALNRFMPRVVRRLGQAPAVVVRHQAGRGQAEAVVKAYGEGPITVTEFIDDMAEAYAWADLVVCRAGAMTVAEVCAAGVAAVFVPFPHAVGDHQTANARYLCDRDAALLMQEAELDEDEFVRLLADLGADHGRLKELATKARAEARPDATQRVADICEETLCA